MSKIQDTIGQWCEETFGPVQRINSVIARANKEMSELLMAPYQQKTPKEMIEECADVVMCLYSYAHLIGEDLDQAIIEKLARQHGNGCQALTFFWMMGDDVQNFFLHIARQLIDHAKEWEANQGSACVLSEKESKRLADLPRHPDLPDPSHRGNSTYGFRHG